ncbi:MAG: hypothetical protein IKR39_05965 [Lachnospiraceae bacterium]|nr:hypothetical protein [Lachnospiraceae bacterium]
MWECDYAREPLDYRLLCLRLIKKIWILPVAALIGMVVIGGSYHMSKLCFGHTRTYQTDSLLYIDFVDTSLGADYDFYNRYTWNEVVTTDFFVDYAYEELGGRVSKDEIRQSAYATVESDVRYLMIRGINKDPQLSYDIERALEKATVAFADTKKEFKSITLVKHDDAAYDASNIRLKTAAVLGACVGLFAALVWWLVSSAADTSIYLPSTLEKRFKIKAIGAPSMSEYEENAKILLGGFNKVFLVPADDKTDVSGVNLYREHINCLNPVAEPSECEKLKDAECVVLAVKAGAHNGKRVERTLEEVLRVGAKVRAFVLVDEDVRLIKWYYRK